MSAPPVLFLDIDGVLNRTKSATHIRLDDDLVERLRKLVAAIECKIVLSTFWRPFLPYIQYILHRHGLPTDCVIGSTPGACGEPGISNPSNFANGSTQSAGGSSNQQLFTASAFDDAQYVSRAAEIGAWLDAHPEVARYVVLDDRPSAADARLAPRFVQTASDAGLTEEDAERCKLLLLS